MASKDSGAGGGFPLSFTTLLALLTVTGSVLMVSRQLSSQRPLASAGKPQRGVGDQAIEARLWEDPFSPWAKLGDPERMNWPTTGFTELQTQIRSRLSDGNTTFLLPVMVPGGTYSEDREARIRSRFAIVSALGQAGYAPEDSEHLGAVRVLWPRGQALRNLANNKDAFVKLTASVTNLPVAVTNAVPAVTNVPAAQRETNSATTAIWLSFEWYRQRTFHPQPTLAPSRRRVLLMWLDEGDFAEGPLIQAALLLRPLVNDNGQDGPAAGAALIGPRFSQTLRVMLDGEFARKLAVEPDDTIRPLVTNTLKRVSLFLATPNAMDEVLVRTNDYLRPRLPVEDRLGGEYFKEVRNFAATDSQLAAEILDELHLRKVDPTELKQHLVLISEWDSFYGRMLSLTYAAELAVRQGRTSSRADFVDRYRRGDSTVWPSNLSSFVFLRGLDGQTSSADPAGGVTEDLARNRQGKPASLDELKQWAPDANKAEGRAQFDYLSRLGNHIKTLDVELRSAGRGRVSAIGIVGGDMYDTLLILQALRSRFPNVVFFTTELDARLWHPKEWEWTRNMIVASGYGLQLHPSLQRQIPPFRDGMQTAQFATALAALGHPSLAGLTHVPPRRFEIGRNGGVNLSVANGGVLHPPAPWQRGVAISFKRFLPPFLLACLGALTVMTLIWRPWRALTLESKQFKAESLWLREEDIGGLPGFSIIWSKLNSKTTDPVAQWLIKRWENRRTDSRQSGGGSGPPQGSPPAQGETGFLKREESPSAFSTADLVDLTSFAAKLKQSPDAVTTLLKDRLSDATRQALAAYQGAASDPSPLRTALAKDLNTLVEGLSIYDAQRFSHVVLRPETRHFLTRKAEEPDAARLNRLLIEDAYPAEILRREETPARMQEFLDFLNQELKEHHWLDPDLLQHEHPFTPEFRQRLQHQESEARQRQPFLLRNTLATLRANRRVADRALSHLLGTLEVDPEAVPDNHPFTLELAAACARRAGLEQYRERRRQWRGFWIGSGLLAVVALALMAASLADTFGHPGGEPLSLVSGTSAWPAAWLRLLAIALAGIFIARSYAGSRATVLELTRRYRLPWSGKRVRCVPTLPTTPIPHAFVAAGAEWVHYHQMGRARNRLIRILPIMAAYMVFAFGVMLFEPFPLKPLRGSLAAGWEIWLLLGAALSFLLLTFGTMDAIRLCRWLIERLSQAPTRYPRATREHFQQLRGGLRNPEILSEWLNLQLIAELTQRVGRLIYYPFIVFFVLLLSRNNWWDRWSWSIPLVVIFLLNLAFAVGSGFILQRSAHRARDLGVASLQQKLNRLRGAAAKTDKEKEQHEVSQAETLLDEIRNLRTGAFGSFWENPILGALLVPSGGTAAIEILSYLMGR